MPHVATKRRCRRLVDDSVFAAVSLPRMLDTRQCRLCRCVDVSAIAVTLPDMGDVLKFPSAPNYELISDPT